jgi:hypothetical protein
MYFFVAKSQPELAERLAYGLKKSYDNGQHDRLIQQYFGDSLKLLQNRRLRFIALPNTNIDPGFFERDRRYLLPSVIAQEKASRR